MEQAIKGEYRDNVRLFRNDFLEALTHVHPLVPLLCWSPVALVLLWRSVTVHGLPAGSVLGVAVLGMFVWTLTEYLAHRFLFHFPARSRAGQYLVFLFHGVHHVSPQDKTRLVMPPAGAIILMASLWGLFSLIVPRPWIEPFMGAFIIGYLIYDYIHYATHHFPMRNRLAHYLKRRHMQHHFRTSETKFGVSSPLWDWVFRTM